MPRHVSLPIKAAERKIVPRAGSPASKRILATRPFQDRHTAETAAGVIRLSPGRQGAKSSFKIGAGPGPDLSPGSEVAQANRTAMLTQAPVQMRKRQDDSSPQPKDGLPGSTESGSQENWSSIVGPHGGGRPLPAALRTDMESALDQDLADIRIFENDAASKIDAAAFTQGNQIHFHPGLYQPQTFIGRKLIGHELAHVAQQRAGRVTTPTHLAVPITDDPRHELEADSIADKIVRGERALVPGSTAGGGTASASEQPAGESRSSGTSPNPAFLGAGSPAGPQPVQRGRFGDWVKKKFGRGGGDQIGVHQPLIQHESSNSEDEDESDNEETGLLSSGGGLSDLPSLNLSNLHSQSNEIQQAPQIQVPQVPVETQEQREKRLAREADRQQLASMFEVTDDLLTFKDNQISQEKFDQISAMYSTIREGGSRIKLTDQKWTDGTNVEGMNQNDTKAFKTSALGDIAKILQTSTGRSVIEALHGGDHDINLNNTENTSLSAARPTNKAQSEDGTGTGSTIRYKAGSDFVRDDGSLGGTSDTVLLHEMIHAYHNLQGSNKGDATIKASDTGVGSGHKDIGVKQEEYATTGLGDFADQNITENAYRNQQRAIQPTQQLQDRYKERQTYRA